MTASELLIRTLMVRDKLSAEEIEALRALPVRERAFGRGEAIVEAGSEPRESCLLISGFAGREVLLDDGGRQITALHIAGDFVDLHALMLKVMDHGVVALSDCSCAFVQHTALVQLTSTHPHLSRMLWLLTLIDSAVQRQWMTSMGRRSALEQIAHLICELYTRMEIVGLARGGQMSAPLTQTVLADALGLSDVHINRTLKALRQISSLTWKAGVISIASFDALAELCDFDPGYLNLVQRPR
ncbi:Crp/Fnr family transcriptional regulator [Bosea sp. CS1GBMeth4]|uniref:Crp/Fnr family transcriptional regulator n=1 Tax=Bosea sp. CS1GBMeth4 TaxID=1892849 RepID=UPI001648647D|nr:Crp/Fnr family transcriptional regulator [Bosea sp. CS1GBMeth4]